MNENYQFFMKSDVSNYTGEWVAVHDKKIVSHGKEFKKVLTEAKKKHPKQRPFIARVPEKETMIF